MQRVAFACGLLLASVGCGYADGAEFTGVDGAEPSAERVPVTPTLDASPPAPTATDGLRNGAETDVDCGGPGAPVCTPGQSCQQGSDCSDGVCTEATCRAATASDGVKNGSETDLDCGGASAPSCATGKTCEVHADCASDGCDYQHQCVEYRSCTAHEGGDTCGVGEVDDAGRQHESCCTALPLPSGAQLDKYIVTAGRMRAFVERVNGDVAGWLAAHKPAWWDGEYAVPGVELPADLDAVYLEMSHVGQSAGCFIGAPNSGASGVRTYWIPDAASDLHGSGRQSYPQSVLDTKALNCVRRYMLAALCAFDGKRLPVQSELQAAWGGTDRKYPWGGAAFNSTLAVHQRTYVYPAPIAGSADQAYHMAAPGRRPLGYGPLGHADVAGLLLEHGAGGPSIGKGSYENHAINTNAKAIAGYTITRKYAAIGGRCARD